MDKLELGLNYRMKTLFIFIISIFFIIGCSENKEKKIKKPTEKMVNVVKKYIDTNDTLSINIQKDGIVVDGARDEELLDAFGLAVSQVIVEDGVTVPDCSALEKTGYLSKEECVEISEKYFGFYTVGEDGMGSKADDIFSSGIAGGELNIKDSDISYFDSTGNPLLENQVEFDEVVAGSNDLEFLKGLKNAIPENKNDMLSNVKRKINFLEDVESDGINQIVDIVKHNLNKDDSKDVAVNNTIENLTNEEKELKAEALAKHSSAISQLEVLKIKHKITQKKLEKNPNNAHLNSKFDKEEQAIIKLEQDIATYESMIDA